MQAAGSREQEEGGGRGCGVERRGRGAVGPRGTARKGCKEDRGQRKEERGKRKQERDDENTTAGSLQARAHREGVACTVPLGMCKRGSAVYCAIRHCGIRYCGIRYCGIRHVQGAVALGMCILWH